MSLKAVDLKVSKTLALTVFYVILKTTIHPQA